LAETHELQEFEEECPGYGIEGLCDINFEKNRWPFHRMQEPASELDRPEIIVDAATTDEGALVRPHQRVQELG
jgi:hypothetical protein